MKTDKTSNFELNIPIKDTNVINGVCCNIDDRNCSESITMAWEDKRYLLAYSIENQMTFTFRHNERGYGLVEMLFELNNPQIQSELSFLYYEDDELSAENKKSYFCENSHEFRLTDKNRTFVMGYLKVESIHFEAFKISGKNFSNIYDCNGNHKKSSSYNILPLFSV